MIAEVLPIWCLVVLEAQVSGTIFSIRHVWFLTGVYAFIARAPEGVDRPSEARSPARGRMMPARIGLSRGA
jgi:hypothetical protein